MVKAPEFFVDERGDVYFTVTSNGMTWEGWKFHFLESGVYLWPSARLLFEATEETPTENVSYDIVVHPGLWTEWTTAEFRVLAEMRGWGKPNLEASCLLLSAYLSGGMGTEAIVSAHEPFIHPDGTARLLGAVHKAGPNSAYLDAWLNERWPVGHRFAFLSLGDLTPK